MNYQYSVINKCLQLLKQSDMANINKLRAELKLIQIKRVMLDDSISDELKYASCGKEVFDGLLSDMQRICQGNCGDESTKDLLRRIGTILTTLGAAQRSQQC